MQYKLPQIKFSLRSLLFGAAVFAVGVLIVMRLYDAAVRCGNHDEIILRLNSVKGIDDVRIGTVGQGFADIATDVDLIVFRISGRPDSLIGIVSPDPHVFENTEHIGLAHIADMDLSVTYRSADGQVVGAGFPDIGTKGPFAGVVPFTPRNLSELISHYDELEAFFRQWPVYPRVGILKVSDTASVEYYRVDARAVQKRSRGTKMMRNRNRSRGTIKGVRNGSVENPLFDS